MRDQDVKQSKIHLALNGIIFLVHAHMLITTIYGLMFAAHAKYFPLAIFVVCWAALAVAVSGWYFILFSVQIRHAQSLGNEISIHRFFAPTMRISDHAHSITRLAVIAPSLSAPRFQRGILFIVDKKLLYISNESPETMTLINHFLDKGPKGSTSASQ